MGDGRMLFMLRTGTPLALDGATRSVFTTKLKLLCALVNGKLAGGAIPLRLHAPHPSLTEELCQSRSRI